MTENEIDPRTPKIIEMRKSGASWTAISDALDIPRRSLFNLRHSDGFMKMADEIWMQIWADIEKQRSIDANYNLGESIKNQMKLFMLLSGTNLDAFTGEDAKTMMCDETCPHYTQMITDRGKAMSSMCKMAKITPQQWANVEKHFPLKWEAKE